MLWPTMQWNATKYNSSTVTSTLLTRHRGYNSNFHMWVSFKGNLGNRQSSTLTWSQLWKHKGHALQSDCTVQCEHIYYELDSHPVNSSLRWYDFTSYDIVQQMPGILCCRTFPLLCCDFVLSLCRLSSAAPSLTARGDRAQLMFLVVDGYISSLTTSLSKETHPQDVNHKYNL